MPHRPANESSTTPTTPAAPPNPAPPAAPPAEGADSAPPFPAAVAGEITTKLSELEARVAGVIHTAARLALASEIDRAVRNSSAINHDLVAAHINGALERKEAKDVQSALANLQRTRPGFFAPARQPASAMSAAVTSPARSGALPAGDRRSVLMYQRNKRLAAN
jgi:hypothetical protein